MEVSQLFNSFSRLRIMVIGDVMVDAYLFGKVDRISPEAPVPVVSVQRRLNRLGGAANVALNLKALGVEPVLCSVIGKDTKGEEFLELLKEQQIGQAGILASGERITTTKFRVIGNNTQMLRVDEEVTAELGQADEAALVAAVEKTISDGNIHAVIFQDYDKGVLTNAVISNVIERARMSNIPVIVDPKRRHFSHYTGVSLFKPNLKEIREGLNMEVEPGSDASLADAADRLHQEMGVERVMITLSDEGVFISEKALGKEPERYRVPAHRRSISDVSGAGDTVVSVAAACLAAGLQAREIAAISNLAGGLVCEQVGVVPVDKDRLMAEARQLPG